PWFLLHRHVLPLPSRRSSDLFGEVVLDDLPDRRTFGRLVDRSPAGNDIILGWLDRLAVLEQRHRGNSAAHRSIRVDGVAHPANPDRKSTRLNSSHVKISYAVF